MKKKTEFEDDRWHLERTVASAAEILARMDKEFRGPGNPVEYYDALFLGIKNASTYGELLEAADRFIDLLVDMRHRILRASRDLQAVGFGLFVHGPVALPPDPKAVSALAMSFAIDSVFANYCFNFLSMAHEIYDIAAGAVYSGAVSARDSRRIQEAMEKTLENRGPSLYKAITAKLREHPRGRRGPPGYYDGKEDAYRRHCVWIWHYHETRGISWEDSIEAGRRKFHYRPKWKQMKSHVDRFIRGRSRDDLAAIHADCFPSGK